MNKITKKELAELLVNKLGCTKKDATETLTELFDEITKTVKKGDVVDVSGFGKFVLKESKAKTGVNPATGEKIDIPAKKAPKFRPAKAFKEAVK